MAKKYTKRPDGRYQKQITLIDQNGLKFKKRVYARSPQELDANVIKAIENNALGITPRTGNDITVGQYADQWLDTVCMNRSENTYKFYALSVKHIQETLGSIYMRDLKKIHIQQAVNSFRDHPRTAQIFRMTMKQICECAFDDQTISGNPCHKIMLPKYKAEEKRALTQIELDAIRKADLTSQERLFVSLLLNCGLRRGEALALSRKDIDLKRDVLTVSHSLAFPDNKGYLKEPKTDSSRREIPIPDELKDLLREYKYDLYLFTTQNGDLFSRSAYRKMWNRILKKLNETAGSESIDLIQGLTAHIFRHNYATMLWIQGVDIITAQHLLGHSSSEVTRDIYTHFDKTLSKSQVAKIKSIISLRIA